MKAKIHVTLKPGILDPQGKAVEHALSTLGYQAVSNVRIGKHIELELDETAVPDAEAQVKAMCEKLLANTIIEEYVYELESDRKVSLPEQDSKRLIVLEQEEEDVSAAVGSGQLEDADDTEPPVTAEAPHAALFPGGDQTPWATANAQSCRDPKTQEDARRLAKRILSDLVSLNRQAVDEGVRNGNFRQMLKEDLDEGLRLFRQQVQESVRVQHDYFGEAVDEFINERQRSLGMK